MIILNPHSYTPPSPLVDHQEGYQRTVLQEISLLDLTKPLPLLEQGSIVLLGFSSDEGVKRDLGRFGAADGPSYLIHTLKKFPWSFPQKISLWDAGSICFPDNRLEEGEKLLEEIVAALRAQGAFVIVIGGGHELSWGHFQGIVKSLFSPEEKLSIDVLHLGAHFNLKPLFPHQQVSSGNSLHQIYEYSQKKRIESRYAYLGIQSHSNTFESFKYADSIKAYAALADEMINQPEKIHQALEDWLALSKKIYLTLSLDVFAAAFAPGVSAPQALGMSPHQLLPFFRQVLASGKVAGFDIAELNPIYDQDGHTARLAVSLLLEVLKAISQYH